MNTPRPLARYAAPLLATTWLAVGLAGCGGGGSSGKAVSSSPAAPSGNTPAANADSTRPDASAAPGASSQGRASTVASGPISASGISGAALAAMLDTRGNGVTPFGPADAVEGRGRWGPKVPEADSHKLFLTMHQWLTPDGYAYPSPGHRENSPYDPGIYRTLDGTARYNATSDVVYRWDTSKNATIPYVRHWLGVDITASATQLSINHTLDLNWQLQTGTHAEAGAEQSLLLSATTPYKVDKTRLIPFDKPLHEWRHGDARVQLRVLKGRDAREALLCWDYALPDLARLVCRAWQFPASWKAGQAPRRTGYFVEDDRSRRPGESGKLRWFLSEREGEQQARQPAGQALR
ncbi:MAG: hypothetical protein Q4E06_01290 [Lautropia sp.]|nr:hypothetical protein [Lautropia sp.]